MEIRLHETLRTLRREKNITQEELASFLGISAQAVSKWERGDGMPDITLLPRLSRYFDVSVDTLLGMEDVRVDELMEEYEKEAHRLANQGKTEERLALWEKAYAEYPHHPAVLHGLMYALFAKHHADYADRIIELAEELYSHPKASVEYRSAAIQMLTFAYEAKGNMDKSKHYASMATGLWCCKETLLLNVLDGEEGCAYAQEFFMQLISEACLCAKLVCYYGKYSSEKSIRVWKSMIRIFESVYEDGDYGFFACRMGNLYESLSLDYAKQKDAENCLASIEKSADFAILYDTAQASQHISPLVDRCRFDPKKSAKNYAENDSALLLRSLKNKLYDFVREDARFMAVVEKLSAMAK